MPLFADLDAMQARFEPRDLLQLTDHEDTGEIVSARIDQAIDSADATIRSHVAARHKDVDTLAGNPVLTDIACDIAFFRLWRSDPPDWVKERWKAAMRALEAIRDGKTKLDGGTEEAPARPGQILTATDQRRFGRDNLGSY